MKCQTVNPLDTSCQIRFYTVQISAITIVGKFVGLRKIVIASSFKGKSYYSLALDPQR